MAASGTKQNWINEASVNVLCEKLAASKTIDQCSIICELVNRNETSELVRVAIKEQESNNLPFWNSYLVADFAKAALHILGLENYSGHREETSKLIACKLQFA